MFSAGAHEDILKKSNFIIRHGNNVVSDAKILAKAIAAAKPQEVAGLYIENEWSQSFNTIFQEHLPIDSRINIWKRLFKMHPSNRLIFSKLKLISYKRLFEKNEMLLQYAIYRLLLTRGISIGMHNILDCKKGNWLTKIGV